MLKKSSIIIPSLLLLLSQTYAQDTKISFQKGDIVEIEKCDKWQWCKLEDGSGYVKGYFFKKYLKSKNKVIKVSDTTTYLYNIRPIYKNEKSLNNYLEHNVKFNEYKNTKENFAYGYVRVKDLKAYENSLVQQKKKIVKKEVVKEVITPVEVKKEIAKKETKKITKTEIIIDKEIEPKVQKEVIQKEENKYFVYGNIGNSFVDINADDSDYIFDGGFGYEYSDKYFFTLGYQHTFLTNMYISTAYLSANYKLKNISYNPYIGAMLGYSTLDVYNDPITNQKVSGSSTSKASLGLQAGASVELDSLHTSLKDLYLTGTIQHINYSLETKVNTKNIKVKNANNMFVGLKYNF